MRDIRHEPERNAIHDPSMEDGDVRPADPIQTVHDAVTTLDPELNVTDIAVQQTVRTSPPLVCLDRKWDVRKTRAESFIGAWIPDATTLPAFTPPQTGCTLRFMVGGQANDWTVSVGARTEECLTPLTVADVLVAIDKSLYSELDPGGMVLGDARYADAVEERIRRDRGTEDAMTNTFRRIDLYPEASHSRVQGLTEHRVGTDTQFLVVMGKVL